MSTTLRKPMTIEAFLAWEERQEVRWEFDGFAPVAMTGGSNEHEVIGNNLRALLLAALRGKRCGMRGPTMKIEVAGRIRYPDAFVFCSATTRGQTVVTDPVVVFEVLSPSTSHIDRIDKLGEYQAAPSIQRYVILEQDAIAATVYVKQGDTWTVTVVTGEAVLAMPEIEADIRLADIYAGVELAPDSAAEG
jgi:Uma2 family endonuclease